MFFTCLAFFHTSFYPPVVFRKASAFLAHASALGRHTSEPSNPSHCLEKELHFYGNLASSPLSHLSHSHRFPRAAGLSLELTQIPLSSNFYLISLMWGRDGGSESPKPPSSPPADQPVVHAGEKDPSWACVTSTQGEPLCLQTDTTHPFLFTQASHFKIRAC